MDVILNNAKGKKEADFRFGIKHKSEKLFKKMCAESLVCYWWM